MLRASRLFVLCGCLCIVADGCMHPTISPSGGSGGVAGSGGQTGRDGPAADSGGRASAGSGIGSSNGVPGDIGDASSAYGKVGSGGSNITAGPPADSGATTTGGTESTGADSSAGGTTSTGGTNSSGDTALWRLDSLRVTPLTLSPQFSPAIHDYFVACSAGMNSLTIAAAALPGATVRLLRPTTTAAASSQNVRVDLLEDQAVVLEVAALGSADQYWVRCLPHDFPAVNVTSYPSLGSPTPGWYLFANDSLASGESSFAMAVDRFGTPVWYRRVSTTVGALNVDALETNTISFTPLLGSSFGTEPNGRYEIHRLGASQVRYVQSVGSPTDHHELRLLSNGDAMVISYALTAGVDLTGNGHYGPNTTIANCAIEELDNAGHLVWSWLASDHFDPGKESVAPPLASANGEDVVDIFHCNSIDVGADGNLLVSARHLNAIFMINKATGKVVWKMGGVAYNKDGAQLIRIQGDPESSFNRQHDARLRPNGNVSLFDDQSDGAAPARGVEYSIDFSSGLATVVWEYRGHTSSGAMGSCRRYADGNTVIGWGSYGAGLVLSEVDSMGHDVLDIAFASGDVSYRAVKVTPAMVDLNLLREAAGLP